MTGGGKEVKEVRVPMQVVNGQDLISLGIMPTSNQTSSYKVHGPTASHKGDAGTYSVHLYYMLDESMNLLPKLQPQCLNVKIPRNKGE